MGAKPKDVLEIPTTCNGMHEKTPHPTQKPEELLRKIILASSNVGDVVLDPFCGSGTTPVCAEQLKRKWMACDLSVEYLDWATTRLELVEDWSIEKWIQYDFENQKRRNSIR
jgi:site-specific DNA-methyltransferase (adenine-specific)